MLRLSAGEREFMTEMRVLTTDGRGREVLAGLTVEESETYVRLSHAVTGDEEPEAVERYLALDDRHERARMQILAAENELRTLSTPVN